MGVHKININFCLLLYNDFFLCVIQHEMFIFRTTLVNTVIVIILSTNVIQFYCVTSECGVFLSSTVIQGWDLCLKKVVHPFLSRCSLEQQRLSIWPKGTALDAKQPPETACSLSITLTSRACCSPWYMIDLKAQSFPQFVVSAAYKNALFSVWSRWKGAHNISERRALVAGITFSHINEIHFSNPSFVQF